MGPIEDEQARAITYLEKLLETVRLGNAEIDHFNLASILRKKYPADSKWVEYDTLGVAFCSFIVDMRPNVPGLTKGSEADTPG